MQESSTNGTTHPTVWEFRQDLERQLRQQVREAIESVLDAELAAVLGSVLTFYEFPKAMWKSLRTTNTLENLNREFRRRTKTQASFGTEAAAVTLLYGRGASASFAKRRPADGGIGPNSSSSSRTCAQGTSSWSGSWIGSRARYATCSRSWRSSGTPARDSGA